MDDGRIIGTFPSGVVTPPPSKSLCHRAVICAALASRRGAGESVIRNIGRSEDVSATLGGVRALGADWTLKGDVLRVRPGHGGIGAFIDCGESASTLRFLLPVAALDGMEMAFTGRGRLLSRPLDAYEAVFADACIGFVRNPDEIRVRGPLRGGAYTLPGDVSSQFVSGLLLALPLAEGDSELRLAGPLESRPYVDLTIDVMKRFGVVVEQPDDTRYLIKGGQRYRSAAYEVEADYSQAAYFLAAAALGREVKCRGLNRDSLQGDAAILDVLRDMGAELRWDGDILSVRAEKLSAVTVDARDIPDLVPPIAVLCCFCEGTSRIINAGRLRLKESDRLRAVAEELGRLGANIEEGADSLTVTGVPRLKGGVADAHNDHRIAMSVALAAIRCAEPVTLSGWRSVNKSYPNFWTDFEGARI